MQQQTYRKVTVAILMAVMLLAVFPKSYLHNFFSNHTDQQHHCPTEQSGRECLHHWGYACEVNDLVVSHSYSFGEPVMPGVIPFSFFSFNDIFIPQLFTSSLLSPEGRGPPSMS